MHDMAINYSSQGDAAVVLPYDRKNIGPVFTEHSRIESQDLVRYLTAVEETLGKGSVVLFGDEQEKNPTLLHYFNTDCYTSGYIGIVEHEGTTLVLKSRFDRDEQNACFSNYLIASALDNTVYLQEQNPQVSMQHAISQLLVVTFLRQIQTASKKGLFRKYQTFEGNDLRIKGKIDLARHLKHNIPFRGKVAYSYREYTIQNEVNQIISTAYHLAMKEYKWVRRHAQRYGIEKTMQMVCDANPPVSREEVHRLISANNRRISHSIYKDWEAVRKTAVHLLKHMGVNIGSWQVQTVSGGILINMDALWERYIERVLWKHGVAPPDQKVPHPILMHGQGAGGHLREITPDFLWKGRQLVLDAKNKTAWSKLTANDASAREYTREDIFQVLAYMYSLQCTKGGIVCPAAQFGGTMRKGYRISDDVNHEFYILGIAIPASDTWKEFSERIRESEKRFAEAVKGLLEHKPADQTDAAVQVWNMG